jgi:hypothetical protein
MIVQFPSAYPDELVYSQFARYYMRSGYINYIFAAEELYVHRTVRPDVEFVNEFTAAAIQMLTRNRTMEQVIEKHTMFPYYGRFLQKERKQKAFDSLVSMQGNYHNLLPMPKRKTADERYLRYCPLCVDDDRKQYGETYWHRIHQMQGINICPVHGCRLVNSNVIIGGKASPTLITAEEVVVDNNMPPVFSENEIECKLARYAAAVFRSEIDLESNVTVGQFLHSEMGNTVYRSVRGKQRNIALLHKDFTGYYQGLPDNWFTELWQIQKVMTDDRVNFYEICLLAMFLNVPVSDLVNMELPEKSQEQLFDEEIYRLREQGLKYPEIARRLNAPYDTVKAIGEQKYRKYQKKTRKPLKSGVKTKDWKQVDKDTLPLVKDAIRQLQGDGISRPMKVSVFAVEKLLGLPSKRISLYLPKCKVEIERNQETQLEYWARETVWAVNKVLSEGQPLNWKHVRSLTNMRKKDLVACLPYLNDIDLNIAKQIEEII